MTPLFRHVVLLVCSVALFFIVLGALLWGRYATMTIHARYGNELIAPTRTHLAHAQRALVAFRADLYRHGTSDAVPDVVPFRFAVVRNLDSVEQHLKSIVRLANAFDYRGAFDLPMRARQQLQSARTELLALEALSYGNTGRALSLFDPLQDTLEQLERIYELERHRSGEAGQNAAAHSLRLVVAAVAVLCLVSVPLIGRLVLGLRSTLRREARTRNDLEEARRNLETLAMYDGLTGLGNRHLFKARLDQAAGLAGRSHRFSALMYIDLDNFKRINDSLGHDHGDEVLKIIGARLTESVRATDTVARIGGDEFTVILTDMPSCATAGTIAANLLRRISEPMYVRSNELVVSASIGITVTPTDGSDPAVLMKNADMALYKAKEHGRDNFQFFVETMNRAMVAQMTMENALRTGLRGNEFALHYQPQVDLATGKVTCVEALLRWRRTDGTLVSPAEFIPVADATGILTEIGGWALGRACRDLAHLRRAAAPDLRMSVNLSARQFRQPDLSQRIRDALDESGLAPSALEVEITETTLIQDIDATIKTLQALRSLGVAIAIDDFGVGYSSLNYLKRLPIDALKIDRSFVSDIESDESDRSIVDAILAMVHSLSLRVVAEGIETRWQLDYLAAKRCTTGQGFLFSKAMPVEGLDLAEIERTWSPALAPCAPRALHLVE